MIYKKPELLFRDQTVLITGGTGTLGNALVERILPQKPRRLIVLSRDECKQNEMRKRFPDHDGSPMRYFIGDVRDRERLWRAFAEVDIVIHAAAMKQVPACEYNPHESVATNIMGTQNVIEAALDRGVAKALLISTDKAVGPANTYGACKLVAERLFVQANSYSGNHGTRFAVCRYGNVMGSRGSVIPLFREQSSSGVVTVTDERMTRFWITLHGALDLIETSLRHMTGGETFVPKIPTATVADIARAIAPNCTHQITGIRPGEKLYETLISEEEARSTIDAGSVYIIHPAHQSWRRSEAPQGTLVPDGWSYRSDTNPQRLSVAELQAGGITEGPVTV